MNSQLQRPRDVASGILVMAIGALFLMVGWDLEFGSSLRMGPGYIPFVLSVLTVLLGAVLTWKGLQSAPVASGMTQLPWIGLFGNLGAVLFFGLTVRGLGLAPVVAITVLITASTSRYARLHVSLALALGVAAFCALLFRQLLGLPVPVIGPWLMPETWLGSAQAAVN